MISRKKLQKYVWMTPAVLAVLALPASIWLEEKVGRDMERGLRTQLETTRDVTAAVLREWAEAQLRVTRLAHTAPAIQRPAQALLELGALGPQELVDRPEQQELRRVLGDVARPWDIDGYYLWVDGQVVSAFRTDQIGRRVAPQDIGLDAAPPPGRAVLAPPRHFELDAGDKHAQFFWAVIGLEAKGKTAFLAFRIDAERSLTRLFAHSFFGRTGESYAIGSDGAFLTEPRFLDTLLATGAVSRDHEEAFRQFRVQQPGMLLTADSEYPQGEFPLTTSASEVVQQRAGSNIEGYSDYRGETVIGAWRWFPELGFGLVTELAQEEALEPLATPRFLARLMMVGLALSSVAFFIGGRVLQRIAAKAQKAQKLGQYVLEKKIGEGGMGAVYRARHALLRRPTAVKLIHEGAADQRSFARFEREVQTTAELSHPNTIQIYDYGHTEAGVFYYAMEYLEGFSLEALVRREGALPQGRVVHFLIQIMGALTEAHERGLIHRDIKPANLMVCSRGGMSDFIKVLDFGLVKDSKNTDSVPVTQANTITGTPQYIAPEAIVSSENVTAKSDLYAVGCVAYFLLTGRVAFNGNTLMTVLSQHMSVPPVRPSEMTNNPIEPALETLVLTCLAKNPDERPANSRILLESLEALTITTPALRWSSQQADHWWKANPIAHTTESSLDSDETMALKIGSRPEVDSGAVTAENIVRRASRRPGE